MKITSLSIRNFLGISQLKSGSLGKMNIVVGDNGTGKSSVLKAIQEAFRSSGVTPDLIRVGADKAEILIEIDENFSVL